MISIFWFVIGLQWYNELIRLIAQQNLSLSFDLDKLRDLRRSAGVTSKSLKSQDDHFCANAVKTTMFGSTFQKKKNLKVQVQVDFAFGRALRRCRWYQTHISPQTNPTMTVINLSERTVVINKVQCNLETGQWQEDRVYHKIFNYCYTSVILVVFCIL